MITLPDVTLDRLRKMSTSRLDSLSDEETETDEPQLDSLKRPLEKVEELNVGDIEELKKKIVRRQKVFTEEMLTGRDGLVRIYEDFPRDDLFHGRGYELQDMKRLLKLYKEWGFQMYPGLAWPDLLSRCETFGHRMKTKNSLQVIRHRERDRCGVRPVTCISFSRDLPCPISNVIWLP